MAKENLQVTIGFQASPPLNLRAPEEQIDALLKKIGDDGWHDLETTDGQVRLSLQHVLYVRKEREEHRVGFGIAG
jgi:hypothetical protein